MEDYDEEDIRNFAHSHIYHNLIAGKLPGMKGELASGYRGQSYNKAFFDHLYPDGLPLQEYVRIYLDEANGMTLTKSSVRDRGIVERFSESLNNTV